MGFDQAELRMQALMDHLNNFLSGRCIFKIVKLFPSSLFYCPSSSYFCFLCLLRWISSKSKNSLSETLTCFGYWDRKCESEHIAWVCYDQQCIWESYTGNIPYCLFLLCLLLFRIYHKHRGFENCSFCVILNPEQHMAMMLYFF